MSPTQRHIAGDGQWVYPATYLHRTLNVDDVIYFKWINAEHNVMIVEDYDGTDKCHDGDSIMDWTDIDGYHHVNFTFAAPQTYYFYCNKGNHCLNGMHKTVTVLPKGATYTNATPGYYNDPYDQMVVKGCTLGSYQSDEGITSCKTSTSCEVGKYVRNYAVSHKANAASDRECMTCSNDRFSTSPNVASCTSCETGKRANIHRTGCEDSDGDDMPAWIWGAIGGGIGFVLIVTVIIMRMNKSKAKGYDKIETSKEKRDSNIRALIF